MIHTRIKIASSDGCMITFINGMNVCGFQVPRQFTTPILRTLAHVETGSSPL